MFYSPYLLVETRYGFGKEMSIRVRYIKELYSMYFSEVGESINRI